MAKKVVRKKGRFNLDFLSNSKKRKGAVKGLRKELTSMKKGMKKNWG